jgi:hypothetical protein
MTDAEIRAVIDRMHAACCNALEIFTFSPRPYELASQEDRWP